MKITVFGDSFAGLVTAACFAEVGNDVLCVPLGSFEREGCNEYLLNDEPGLSKLVDTQLKSKRLAYEVSWSKAIAGQDVIFLSLPTQCLAVADEIVEYIGNNVEHDIIVVNQSSSVVGAVDAFQKHLIDLISLRSTELNCAVIAMPTFISEGQGVDNFKNSDRILVGSDDKKAVDLIKILMQPFCRIGNEIIVMSPRAAEYSKFSVNALLATRMSLINELANTAEDFDIDFDQVKQALGTDRRIGFNYLNPGCGFGGPNFAADVEHFITLLANESYDVGLLQKVLENNEQQKEVLFRKVWRYFNAQLKNKTFAIWGLSFKPDTSTVENSSSLKIIESLLAQGASVKVYDPKAMASFKALYEDDQQINYAENMYDALDGVDGLLILTEWSQFYYPDFEKMQKLMKTEAIFDGRNILQPQAVSDLGFDYYGVGRGGKI